MEISTKEHIGQNRSDSPILRGKMHAMSASATRFKDSFSSHEIRLLLGCARRLLGNLEDGEWLDMVTKPLREAVFFEFCREHKMILIANKVLLRPHAAHFSVDLVDSFSEEVRKIGFSQLRLSKALNDVHRSFEARGISHFFMKGPVLNGLLFEGEMLRYSKDLDVAIEARRLPDAHDCLSELGFRPMVPFLKKTTASALQRMLGKDSCYKKIDSPQVIELHWKTDKVEMILNRREFLWTGLSNGSYGNQAFPILSDEKNCLYLCIHAARHHWSRLRWLVDIPILMEKRKLTTEQLLSAAKRHGLVTAAYEALYLADALLGVRFTVGKGIPGNGKIATDMMERILLSNQPQDFLVRLKGSYYKSLLYPILIPRLKYWLIWIWDRASAWIRKLFFSG